MDAENLLAQLLLEHAANLHRESLLKQIETLWATDAKFRYTVRHLVKTSKIKDRSGNKPSFDVEFFKSAYKLGGKLGFSEEQIEQALELPIEPKSIKQAIRRKQK